MPPLPDETLARVADSRLFRGMDLEYLESHLECCRVERLAPRDLLLAPGGANEELYVILTGRLRVHLGELDYPPYVVLEAGECAGELSIIDGQQVSAYVVAEEASTLLAIPGAVLWRLIDSQHALARNLLHILSHRMRDDNRAAVESIRLLQEYQQAATVDGLTGLHNRRWLNDTFRRQFDRCRRNGQPVSVAMADIDHFKDVNDRHGHPTGDRVLIALAGTLRQSLRPSDLLARYGGEEFSLLLPETDLSQALEVAERIRRRVGETPSDGLPAITLSIGVACAEGAQTFDEVLTRADTALYQAKAAGRNRVTGL